MARTRTGRTVGTMPDAAQAVQTARAAAPTAAMAQLQATADRGRGAHMAALQRLADATQAPAQRASLEEEEPLQGKVPDGGKPVQARGPDGAAGGLPGALRDGVEGLSGISLDGVRVHRNSDKPAQIGALAYAQGKDIHLGAGQEKHLPHEAWHIAQQAQGRVQPTTQAAGGVAVNDDAGLEREADVMGARAVQAGTAQRYAEHDDAAGHEASAGSDAGAAWLREHDMAGHEGASDSDVAAERDDHAPTAGGGHR